MLNDWGIYHLHLGEKNREDGFINRTVDLLYIRIDGDNAYFINIFTHDDWGNDDVIRILHNNWPDSIEKFLMKGITQIGKNLADKEYKMLRKAGVTPLITIAPNKTYVLMGGGYTTSGKSLEVVRICDNTRKILRESERYVKENIDLLAENAKSKYNKTLDKNIHFTLAIKCGKIYAYNDKSCLYFHINNFFV